MKPKLLGLYQTVERSDYEDGRHVDEMLLAVDVDEESLRQRWNLQQKEKCLVYAWHDPSYFKFIHPPFYEGKELCFSGSTGGGYSAVWYTISIRPLKQFDDQATE